MPLPSLIELLCTEPALLLNIVSFTDSSASGLLCGSKLVCLNLTISMQKSNLDSFDDLVKAPAVYSANLIHIEKKSQI